MSLLPLTRRALAPDPTPPSAVGPLPPTDSEKWRYLERGQSRWLFILQVAVFLGVGLSLAGFARNSYATLVIVIPLALFLVELLLSLRTSTFARRITPESHRDRVATWQPAEHPSVDVFLPSAGEPTELLANTFTHVSRLLWPGHVEVYVLDDSGRQEVRRLAEDLGFRYLTRTDRSFKKAGNLQHGFTHSHGDLIVIFDADFVPRTDFLLELAPYLDDEQVAIVQSPQYFSTTEEMGWVERSAGATQELFYRMIQPSRDAVGAAICVGTSAVYRRSSLEQIGGFPLISHSEDLYTGIRLGDAGFRLVYVPAVLSRGVCPADLSSFATQQYRWCEGSMALVGEPEFHVEPTMSVRHRLSFWSGFLYYVSTAISVFLVPIPLVVMALAYGDQVQAAHALPLTGALAMWFLVYPLVFSGRWRIEVLRIHAVSGFAHAVCIGDLLRGRTAEWVPTNMASRKSSPLAQRILWLIVGYVTVSQLAVVAALSWGVAVHGIANFWAMVGLAAVNAYVLWPLALNGAKALSLRTSRGRQSLPAPLPEPIPAT